jgi:hypothetical protein
MSTLPCTAIGITSQSRRAPYCCPGCAPSILRPPESADRLQAQTQMTHLERATRHETEKQLREGAKATMPSYESSMRNLAKARENASATALAQ